MNIFLRRSYIFLFICICSGCATETADWGNITPIHTRWVCRLIGTTDGSYHPTDFTFPFDTTYFSLHFNSGSTASGIGACNQFSASYAITPTTITFSDMVSTKIFCGDDAQLEEFYFRGLLSSKQYTSTDSTFTIFCKGDTVSELEFVKK